MSIQNLLNEFLGSRGSPAAPGSASQSLQATLSNIKGQVPGGLVGGAAAGSIMALLMSNKSARKMAGTAATYGGAAFLGGLAYKAYQNWQNTNPVAQSTSVAEPEAALSPEYQLLMVKAMIAAARADGHIDQQEQQRIFGAVEKMDISTETKGLIFDLLQKPIALEELTGAHLSVEQKAELYLASCLVIDVDDGAERAYLDNLASVLRLPSDLVTQLQTQAQTAIERIT